MIDWVERHPDSVAHHVQLARMTSPASPTAELRDPERSRRHARAALDLLREDPDADANEVRELESLLGAD